MEVFFYCLLQITFTGPCYIFNGFFTVVLTSHMSELIANRCTEMYVSMDVVHSLVLSLCFDFATTLSCDEILKDLESVEVCKCKV